MGYFCEQPDVWDLFSQNKQDLIKPGIWRKNKYPDLKKKKKNERMEPKQKQ